MVSRDRLACVSAIPYHRGLPYGRDLRTPTGVTFQDYIQMCEEEACL